MLHRHGNLMRQFLNSGSLSLDNVELEALISHDRLYSEFNMKVSMRLLRMIWVLCRSGENRRKGREMSSLSLHVPLVSGDNQWELGGNQGAQATMVCEAQCGRGLYKLLCHKPTHPGIMCNLALFHRCSFMINFGDGTLFHTVLQLPHLTSLNLYGTNLSNKAVEKMCSGLKSSTCNLEELL